MRFVIVVFPDHAHLLFETDSVEDPDLSIYCVVDL